MDLGPASLILNTYNDAAIMEITLAAFARQSCRDFEVVLADDGSRQDYSPILRAWAPEFAHGILHVKHEDRGFRRARILNRAVHASRFRRLIFSDVDCLPHRHFVRNHLLYLRPGIAVTGRRVHLRRDVVPSPRAIPGRGLALGLPALLRLWLAGKARTIEHGVAIPFFYESRRDSLLGSNFSISKADLIAVNGFNEEYEGWGCEDSDLDFRIKRAGMRVRNLRNRVIQYHLLHAQRSPEESGNRERLRRAMALGVVRAPLGLAEIDDRSFESTRYA